MFRISLLFAAFVVALPLLFASAALPERAAAAKGVAFIRTTQQADGGFGPSGQTMDALYALRAAGVDPGTVTTGGKSPRDYLLANAAAATSVGAASKAALGARALALDPRNVAGTDLLARIEGVYASGRYAEDDFTQSIAMLGLACTGVELPAGAIIALRESQVDDGGWGFDGFSDADTTGIAMQALLAANVPATDGAVTAGVAYLRATQLNDGGWGFGDESNTSSTAFAVQGLIAAGEQLESATYTKDGKTPVTYLLAQQAGDGSFTGFSPAFATNQAVPALMGRTFCNAPVSVILPPTAATPSATAGAAAPAPPNTGNSARAGHGERLFAAVALLALALSGAVATLAVRRR